MSYEIKHVAPLGGSGVILPSSANEIEEVVLLKEIKQEAPVLDLNKQVELLHGLTEVIQPSSADENE